ncbi:similar to Saccharomyces cerevisiae YAL041W CDC24 Guanine nucleotide exchange factor (GEF or GDP-release factor) for Cdc42p [Maudiozyma barnettii]|uniref:Similar to Saccharomyces cerevisiae YAL041W CDC24 Guanine nucleotide exchange factor (GEF or GDP-release factor) for Cdc42p n=1 Tax=Maudiozyma barnettii TaxID=61262 RepID=A0A8H2ZIU4_9SACH|nr:Rho family guanine nucleotide exchange factor CDC24 [Kazachstania barnettii]CAB4255333.1 similar to Saccharomyces cerevisiae YAL041W CDC24 Guanine nucleotide exchange factor (GEF or GDP-release factor) for Cdc42p [Kazachstania barnettii]CAD1783739.1 similar to Saccharomyces cerevisiae YAL041W CDC24 Guanine nucleotide exchange factor (GEF or GDP-release factor) for Cdc42p [Kazachstania barnettii]
MVVVQANKRPSLSLVDSGKSGINIVMSNVMNTAVTESDSLYYVCLNIKKRLEVLPQIQPYLNLAYTSSELLSERQSLLLSQKQQQQLLEQQSSQSGNSVTTNNVHSKNNSHRSISSSYSNDGFGMIGSTGNSTPTTMRSSSISNISFKDEFTLDGITYNSSNGHNSVSMDDTQLTYSMGILPISMDCDPVTQLAQLFQQGSPLCILFNTVRPQYKLPVVSSDDLKICKKSIYDFILGCKKHFAFNDEELFTISDVFANSTNQLVKVLEVVTTLMNAAPEIFPSTVKVQQMIDADLEQNHKSRAKKSKSHEEYDKVIKEFIATERKYVHDLETLDTYKQQLLDNNLITSEELYMLFPNLTEVIDFQRRFLISLEINALVDPQKQRIGALFMHSKFFFKLYEPWSIGQNAAIDFLANTLDKIQDSDLVIKNKLELQSFLYKPVQRLCRYPLLLKELISCNSHDEKSNGSDNISKELEIALDISKRIAMSINENQRRTENHEIVKKLYGRVSNWKGYRIAKFGELLYYDKVFISTNNSSEPEREFEVYLFEKIIILFSEIQPKKSSLILKKKPTSSGSSLTLNLTSSNHHNSFSNISSGNSSGNSSSIFGSNTSTNNAEPKLDLRGRIMIMNLDQVTPLDSRSLNITWESIKEQGNFLLKFKNEETRDNWCSCLQSLVRSVKSESYKSNHSENSFVSTTSSNNPGDRPHSDKRKDSRASNSSLSFKRMSDTLPKQRRRVSNFDAEQKNSNIPENLLVLKIAFNDEFVNVSINIDAKFANVLDTIQKKINHNVSKVKYQDEDGDYIVLASDDDWIVAKDMLRENGEYSLNIWAYS